MNKYQQNYRHDVTNIPVYTKKPLINKTNKTLEIHEETKENFDKAITNIDININKLVTIYAEKFFEFNKSSLREEKKLVDTITEDLLKCKDYVMELDDDDKIAYSRRLKKMHTLMAKRETNDYDTIKEPSKQNLEYNLEQAQNQDTLIYDDTQGTSNNKQRQIIQLSKDILVINQMFTDLNSMIIDHGIMLDKIDDNLSKAEIKVEQGTSELVSAEYHYNSVSSITNKLIVGLGTVIAGLGIYAGIKFSH